MHEAVVRHREEGGGCLINEGASRLIHAASPHLFPVRISGDARPHAAAAATDSSGLEPQPLFDLARRRTVRFQISSMTPAAVGVPRQRGSGNTHCAITPCVHRITRPHARFSSRAVSDGTNETLEPSQRARSSQPHVPFSFVCTYLHFLPSRRLGRDDCVFAKRRARPSQTPRGLGMDLATKLKAEE